MPTCPSSSWPVHLNMLALQMFAWDCLTWPKYVLISRSWMKSDHILTRRIASKSIPGRNFTQRIPCYIKLHQWTRVHCSAAVWLDQICEQYTIKWKEGDSSSGSVSLKQTVELHAYELFYLMNWATSLADGWFGGGTVKTVRAASFLFRRTGVSDHLWPNPGYRTLVLACKHHHVGIVRKLWAHETLDPQSQYLPSSRKTPCYYSMPFPGAQKYKMFLPWRCAVQ